MPRKPDPKSPLLTPEERGARIREARLSLVPLLQRYVTQTAFAQLIAEELGLEKPPAQSTTLGWEKGSEPALSYGLAIARLAGWNPDYLVFRDAPKHLSHHTAHHTGGGGGASAMPQLPLRAVREAEREAEAHERSTRRRPSSRA